MGHNTVELNQQITKDHNTVGRTCILVGSIEQKNKRAEIHTCGMNRWEESMGQQREQREEPMGQQIEQREESMSLLYSPAILREGRRLNRGQRKAKEERTIKNSSNLMLRIETTIKDSRFFFSSALLRD